MPVSPIVTPCPPGASNRTRRSVRSPNRLAKLLRVAAYGNPAAPEAAGRVSMSCHLPFASR
ncbi:hypothetical protein ACQP2F_16675 [Actinoplanes sp. CA-030573]|uniref:hypothetical protein n=1 Tax=Actinoplanes sp. CA-030573 TaxID=3239898 RepID=UPI003D91344B